MDETRAAPPRSPRPPHQRALRLALLCGLSVGCVPPMIEPSTSDATAQTTESTTALTTAGTTDATTATTTTEPGTDSTDDATTEGEALPPYADGISITKVEANQAVAVDVAVNGSGVPKGERAARLVRDRNLALRVYWELDDTWEPRELEARLELQLPDEATLVQTTSKFIDGPSTVTSLGGSLNFSIKRQHVVPGASFVISLHELEPSAAPPPDPPPRMPHDGVAPLGVEPDAMALRYVLVPIDHEYEGCQNPAELTEEFVASMHDHLFERFPLRELDIVVGEPLLWSAYPDVSALLNATIARRASDAAAPEVIYFGLIRPCDYPLTFPDAQVAGILSHPPVAAEGELRTAILELDPEGELRSINSLSWATGRLLGRRDVATGSCDASLPDLDYPHPDGRVGAWGLSVLTGALYSMLTPDHMLYCSENTLTWSGPYGWELEYTSIMTLSSWGE